MAERLVIIGSGPAGLCAAIYAARANLAPRVLAGAQAGGQLMLTTEVENYPGFPNGIMGPELMELFRAQAERFGARIENVDATKVDFAGRPLHIWADDERIEAEAVIVATGASARWLGIPGEERLRGRGVSTCATCDGAFFRERRIAVVGGGDSAMEEAIFLTRFGSSVTVIHRRERLRASKIMAERALAHPKIAFRWNAEVVAAEGEHHLERLLVRDVRSSAVESTAFDALFIAVGHDPNTEIFRGQLALDDRGYIVSSDGVHTEVPGVFVAGDVFDIRYKQAITAAGMGCRAALEAERYLEELEASAMAGSSSEASALSIVS
ncbi:MAG: thioredoxin-disulfide reductase [Vulcanimicrobiaceae bacterium]